MHDILIVINQPGGTNRALSETVRGISVNYKSHIQRHQGQQSDHLKATSEPLS